VQTSRVELGLPSTSEHVRHFPRMGFWAVVLPVFSELRTNPKFALRKSYAIFCNALAHIGIELATMGVGVDPGPVLQYRDGRLTPNACTTACAEGIKTLLAMNPWAENLDARLFVMGFHVGAKFGRGELENDYSIPVQSHTS